jgi:hypothetical protein
MEHYREVLAVEQPPRLSRTLVVNALRWELTPPRVGPTGFASRRSATWATRRTWRPLGLWFPRAVHRDGTPTPGVDARRDGQDADTVAFQNEQGNGVPLGERIRRV